MNVCSFGWGKGKTTFAQTRRHACRRQGCALRGVRRHVCSCSLSHTYTHKCQTHITCTHTHTHTYTHTHTHIHTHPHTCTTHSHYTHVYTHTHTYAHTHTHILEQIVLFFLQSFLSEVGFEFIFRGEKNMTPSHSCTGVVSFYAIPDPVQRSKRQLHRSLGPIPSPEPTTPSVVATFASKPSTLNGDISGVYHGVELTAVL